MGLWKAILRTLGLSNEARVRVSAPGIDVTLTGDPAKVRAVLAVVKQELQGPRQLGRGRGGPRRRRPMQPAPASDSQVVRPTELDEMDSPYALPEAVVMPVPDEDVTDERVGHTSRRSPFLMEASREPDTVLPKRVAEDPFPSEETVSHLDTQAALPTVDVEDGPDAEATAVSVNPSGPLPAVARRKPRPFVTDGGPTLMPTDSENELHSLEATDNIGGRKP